MPRCSLSAIGATIATLAFLAIFYTVYSNSDSITRGVGSLAGIPSGLTPLTVLPLACLAIAIAHFHRRSAAGLALRAVREDEVAARASGIRVVRVKLAAYVTSAFLCGMAGYLQARFLGVVSPDSFYFNATLGALTMLIIGGMYKGGVPGRAKRPSGASPSRASRASTSPWPPASASASANGRCGPWRPLGTPATAPPT
ncbi:MAG: branched-chain amino acid ABC transporter permease [Rhizobiaceae bacterium]